MTETTTPIAKCRRCEHAESMHTKHGCRGRTCSCSGWLAGTGRARAPKVVVPTSVKPKPPSTKRNPKTGQVQVSKRSRTEVLLDAKAKAAKAAKLRAQRYPWDYIARECGYSDRGAAYNAVQRELAAIPREAVEELRKVELESLDTAEAALAKRLAKGDTFAVDSMLRIKHLRAKLTGLYDAPKDTGLAEVQQALQEFLAQARQVADKDGD